MTSIEDFSRMCNHYRGNGEGGGCQNCPLYLFSPTSCHLALTNNLNEADIIISKWCEKHPKKTYADDFFEKFPDAPKDREGFPVVSACNIYGEQEKFTKYCSYYDSCASCWRMQVK